MPRCVVQPGLGRPDRNVEGIGRLAGGQADIEVQGQDGLLCIVEAAKTSLDLIAIRELRRAIGLGRFGRHDRDLRAEPLTVAPNIRTRPDDQAVQPGVEPLHVAQRGQIAPGPHQGILGRILRKFGVAQDEASGCV